MATSCYNYELRMRKPKRGNTLPRAQPDSVFKTRYLCTNAVTIPRQRPFRRGLERLAYISTALSGKSGADTQKSAQKHGEQKSRGTNGRICCNYELRMRTPKRGNTWPRAQPDGVLKLAISVQMPAFDTGPHIDIFLRRLHAWKSLTMKLRNVDQHTPARLTQTTRNCNGTSA